MLVGMLSARLLTLFDCLRNMSLCGLGVVRSCFVLALIVDFGRVAMVLSRIFMVRSGFVMMLTKDVSVALKLQMVVPAPSRKTRVGVICGHFPTEIAVLLCELIFTAVCNAKRSLSPMFAVVPTLALRPSSRRWGVPASIRTPLVLKRHARWQLVGPSLLTSLGRRPHSS
jgi:hypothetical protein